MGRAAWLRRAALHDRCAREGLGHVARSPSPRRARRAHRRRRARSVHGVGRARGVRGALAHVGRRGPRRDGSPPEAPASDRHEDARGVPRGRRVARRGARVVPSSDGRGMRKNRVRELLNANEPALGTFMSLGSVLGAEQLAHVGFDWLVIDQEHGAIDATLTQSLLQAISTTETVPLIRVPHNGVDWIKRALDAGAYGVIVPMVNTREEAEAAVQAAKYPPLGARSIGGSRTRLYGGNDYVERANDEILLIAQIEHKIGVQNAREILSVKGVDAYFIGPGDLCASLGLPNSWDPDYPEYWEAIEKIRRAGVETGKPGGIHASANRVPQMLEKGYRFIAIGFDISFMQNAAAAALQAARPK